MANLSDDYQVMKGDIVVEDILRLPEVLEPTGMARSSIYLWIEEGRFPKQVSLGARSVGWLESEIDAWLKCS
ncbi:MAG: hypothetical protein DHS20C02_11650 [Micavibrio sp.]|nr:MAG: hypothetical protein DHS20C02_11650 [Micavibrio sp.]